MLYSIGDIHGMYNELRDLITQIKNHSVKYEGPHTIVFLGDYIDRGYDSKKVIDFLDQPAPEGFKHIYLKGNHEQMFLDTFRYVLGAADENGDYYTGNDAHMWLQNGGETTAVSYGCTGMDFFLNTAMVRQNMFSLAEFIWKKTQVTYREGKFFFSHAGVDPRGPISDTSENVFLWVRDIFLNSDGPYYMNEGNHDPVIVVHGHTPLRTGMVDVKEHRINVDTMAFSTRVLSAVAIDTQTGNVVKILNTKKDSRLVR